MKRIIKNKYIVFILVGVFLYAFCYWQNNDIVVTEYVYKTQKLDASLDGYKIAQISDLHNKEFGKNQKDILEILADENPTCIVITGDIVDCNRTNINSSLEFVEGAVKIAPVYYVTGNHEYQLNRNEWDQLMQGLEKYGVHLLDNRSMQIEKDGPYFIGLSDENLSDHTLNNLHADLNPEKLQIVLAHEPHFLENYSKSNVDLVFSGHAHGGQFRLPFIGGLIAPNQGFFPKYTSGLHKMDLTTLVVSRGLGNSIIPVRILNRPEIVIVKLQSI